MAGNKGTHSSDIPTRKDFPEAKDKIVDIVELSAEMGYYAITMRFQDSTTLTFSVEPCVVAFPVFSESRDGQEKQLKKYQPIFSKISKV